jgi:hypothetical protein
MGAPIEIEKRCVPRIENQANAILYPDAIALPTDQIAKAQAASSNNFVTACLLSSSLSRSQISC